ncbi:zinc ribbon domain-containing protein [Desulfovermiculus halophilus]|uniref:zinc ribbon domain-containing protein n=1 Tax=Desulfovermiculus halophilus TaxID=339722 RepID=UPI000A0280FF
MSSPTRPSRARHEYSFWILVLYELDYKLNWRGGALIKVLAWYTSQKCSRRDHVSKNNRKSQSLFVCEACGLEMNADHNFLRSTAGCAV